MPKAGKSRNKYHARKTVVDGIVFDSKKEAARYQELKLWELSHEISDLQRQVKFTLIPAQRKFSNEIYTKGKNKGCFKPGKLLEQECSYIADFVYIKGGQIIAEDTKGYRTEAYIIKRKLMLYFYGIKIQEV